MRSLPGVRELMEGNLVKILFAARVGNQAAFGLSRAPDQARRRLAAILGQPVHIVWIGLPNSKTSARETVRRAAHRFGRVSILKDAELGETTLARLPHGAVLNEADVANVMEGLAFADAGRKRTRSWWAKALDLLTMHRSEAAEGA